MRLSFRLRIVTATVVGFALTMPLQLSAADLGGRFSLLGQVREGDQTDETEAPMDVYGDWALTGLPFGSTTETFFRLERDFGTDDGASDFYEGKLRVPGAIPGVDATVGRQFVSQGATGVFIADAAKLKVDPGWPVSFTLFGGAPRYFEPTYSSDQLSQDEAIWGGSIRAARWQETDVTVGYFGLNRSGHVLRQLITGGVNRSFASLPGLPTVYGNVAYDPDHQNLDIATGGVTFMIPQPGVSLNFEGTYYKPQDHEHDYTTSDFDEREDALFELFSNSQLVQWHGAVSYPLTETISSMLDYSFQRYTQQKGDQYEISHIAGAGLVWLPYGDGLEVVKVEYYVINGDGGAVNGGKAYYESRVYEQLLFRSMLDVTGYEKESNQSGVAVNGLLGLGYEILPGLNCEINFEANHNDRFDEDYRFGFVIDYNFRHRLPFGAGPPPSPASAS